MGIVMLEDTLMGIVMLEDTLIGIFMLEDTLMGYCMLILQSCRNSPKFLVGFCNEKCATLLIHMKE